MTIHGGKSSISVTNADVGGVLIMVMKGNGAQDVVTDFSKGNCLTKA